MIEPLLEVNEFKKIRYPGRSPCVKTIKKWIDQGLIPGTVEGTMHFVYVNQLEPEVQELVNRVIG